MEDVGSWKQLTPSPPSLRSVGYFGISPSAAFCHLSHDVVNSAPSLLYLHGELRPLHTIPSSPVSFVAAPAFSPKLSESGCQIRQKPHILFLSFLEFCLLENKAQYTSSSTLTK